MLAIHKVQEIEGITVYGDDQSFNTFYLLPNQPRYRKLSADEGGGYSFKFIKYRFPIDREDGRKGGGYLIFDVEFVVPEEKRPRIIAALQEQVNQEAIRRNIQPAPAVKIGTITYTEGKSSINLSDEGGVLIEKINGAGTPSLYGNNISTFSMELTPEGATLFEQAMQGNGGAVGVIYDLKFMAKLPPVKVRGTFHASAFYSFYQEVDTDWHMWREDEYRETVREQLVEREAISIDMDAGGVTDQKLLGSIRDWATRTVEEAAERKMVEKIAAVSEDGRQVPDGIEDVHREITNHQISSFTLRYKESSTADWHIAPQGILPNITNLKEADGSAVKWEDYAITVDLDDPFFKQLNVAVHVNADFANLPLNSVEVKLNYNGVPMDPGEVRLKSPEDVGKFAAFIANDNWEYTYSYQINYQGESRIFQSEPVTTDEAIITVGVDDVGILAVDIAPGDLNFEQASQALVTFRYEDDGVNPIEHQFTLDANNRNHRVQEVIFQPTRRPYQYRVKYFMANGKELETDWQESRSPNLFINDPFSATKTIGVRAAGDLENDISTIFLDLTYVDETNDYSQTKSIALKSTNPFFDWAVPVIDETVGVVRYSGHIQRRDGTIEAIEPTETTENTLITGDILAGMLKIDVIPELLDFNTVKLVKVALRYSDGNGVDERANVLFKQADATMKTVSFPMKDSSALTYEWSAQYFMQDGSRREQTAVSTDDPTIVLELPA